MMRIDRAHPAWIWACLLALGTQPAARWVITGVDDPRASAEPLMREALAAAGVTAAAWGDTPAGGFERARQLTPAGGRIVVCGSFRIVAPALQWLGLY